MFTIHTTTFACIFVSGFLLIKQNNPHANIVRFMISRHNNEAFSTKKQIHVKTRTCNILLREIS